MPDSVPFSALPKEPEVLDADAARALVASYAPVSTTAAVKDIGRIDAQPGLRLLDAQGQALPVPHASFDHFA